MCSSRCESQYARERARVAPPRGVREELGVRARAPDARERHARRGRLDFRGVVGVREERHARRRGGRRAARARDREERREVPRLPYAEVTTIASGAPEEGGHREPLGARGGGRRVHGRAL